MAMRKRWIVFEIGLFWVFKNLNQSSNESRVFMVFFEFAIIYLLFINLSGEADSGSGNNPCSRLWPLTTVVVLCVVFRDVLRDVVYPLPKGAWLLLSRLRLVTFLRKNTLPEWQPIPTSSF